MVIFKIFNIDAAHRLPNVPLTHKCRDIHGHTYRIEIYVNAPVDKKLGWVADFADVTEVFQPINDRLDHKYLNDIEGLENPTVENLARWIWVHLKPSLPMLSRIVVYETPESGCIYEGEDSE